MRRLLAVTTTALTLAAVAILGPNTTTAQAAPGPILKACTHLKAGTASDRLANGRFTLQVSSDLVEIHETAWMSGSRGRDYLTTGTWFRDDPTGRYQSNTDATLLAFYCNGDLALRHSNGALLWHSNTANKGATTLALTSGGNLVMTTSAGKVVWQSGSGSTLLPANSILRSNSRLVNVWADQQGYPARTLSMQTNGNLVYRVGSTVRWQSRTSVPGSHAAMTTGAQLRVVAPDGRVLWSSGRTGSSYSVLDAGPFWIEQYYPSSKVVWSSGAA
ncbi:MAG: hypothetical protein ACKOVB_09285 [Terrabacter sp.]